MKHIEFEKLVNNFEGSLPLAEMQEIAGHLSECAECSGQAAKLESFFGYANADQKEAVPQPTTAGLLNVFKPSKASPAEKPSLVKRLFASLIFDDWQTALNERFVAGDSRQLLYRAEDFELDLRLTFASGKCRLSGQVFPNCEQSAFAEISSEEIRERAFLNDYCEFSFPPLTEGIYKFRLVSGGAVVEIENLFLVF